LIIKPELERTGFIKDLTAMSDLILSSVSISETERLVNALASAHDDPASSGAQNVVIVGNTLVARIPSYDTTNTGQMDNLGKYLKWAVTVLGLKDPVVKILQDSSLGNAVVLPAKLERMMDNTISAISLPPQESGDRAEFKTGLKANLVELLAATKLLRKYQGSLQKVPAPKGKKSLTTSLDDLRASFNGRAGLNEHGLPAFTAIFVKSVLNELTKPNNSRFPGKWMNSLKVTNGVKSHSGILYKLGFESAVANPQKTIAVVRTTIAEKVSDAKSKTKTKETPEHRDSKKKFDLLVQTKDKVPDGINHREFRLGAFLLLPLINPKSKEGPKDQLSRDPITVREKTITNFYKENRDVVDAMNLAYATMKAIGKKGSKASPLSYRSARGHAISLTANREWMDANGTKYPKLMDVPEHCRNFLLSFFNRKLVEEDSDSDNEEDGDDVPSEEEYPRGTTAE